MSVYTPVTKAQLEKYLQHYAVGELIDFQASKPGWKTRTILLRLVWVSMF